MISPACTASQNDSVCQLNSLSKSPPATEVSPQTRGIRMDRESRDSPAIIRARFALRMKCRPSCPSTGIVTDFSKTDLLTQSGKSTPMRHFFTLIPLLEFRLKSGTWGRAELSRRVYFRPTHMGLARRGLRKGEVFKQERMKCSPGGAFHYCAVFFLFIFADCGNQSGIFKYRFLAFPNR